MREESADQTKKAEEHLKEIQKMVRFGMYRDISSLKEWSDQVSTHLEALYGLGPENESVLRQEDYLQCVSLHAEYLDTMGRVQEAAEVLRKIFPDGHNSVESWMAANPFRPAVHGEERGPAEEERYARWVRQIGWLHMEYAWVFYYRRASIERALEYLASVLAFLQRELIAPAGRRGRPSHGTLFRYFYYRGQCERSLRRFRESLQSFTEAQRHAGERYRLKTVAIQGVWERLPKAEKTEQNLMRKLTPERRFSVISTARILGGGLAWNSIQRGRLRHAQEMCLSAETLLLGTGQEPMRAFIRSNRLVAQRRAENAYGAGFGEAISGLERCFKEYEEVQDPLGQLRCGIEIVRGHLDSLQYWKAKELYGATEGAKKERTARSAINLVLKKLETIAEATSDRHWQFRVKLLRARYDLFLDPTGIRGVVETWRERLMDLAEQHRVGPNEAEHLILLADVERFAGNTKEAFRALQSALGRTRDRSPGQNWDQDPVVRSECHLRLADLHMKSFDYHSAGVELGHWKMLAQLVEHAHLHRFAEELERRLREDLRPEIFQLDDDLNWEVCQRRLHDWIARAAKHRAGPGASGAEIAAVLGVSPSSWSRWYQGPRRQGEKAPGGKTQDREDG